MSASVQLGMSIGEPPQPASGGQMLGEYKGDGYIIPAVDVDKENTMSTTPTEREQFLDDIIIDAVEGGIGYWASIKDYHCPEGGPASAMVREYGDVTAWKRLDHAAVERGLKLVGKADLAQVYKGVILGAEAENDAGNIDSLLADAIVQLGLLGEVVYG